MPTPTLRAIAELIGDLRRCSSCDASTWVFDEHEHGVPAPRVLVGCGVYVREGASKSPNKNIATLLGSGDFFVEYEDSTRPTYAMISQDIQAFSRQQKEALTSYLVLTMFCGREVTLPQDETVGRMCTTILALAVQEGRNYPDSWHQDGGYLLPVRLAVAVGNDRTFATRALQGFNARNIIDRYDGASQRACARCASAHRLPDSA